ncbi:hypothetical protein M441DRAFT_40099 [Trichoderma asperellum CBS 433.97]|uniref:DNA2/NAM7 helicase-like C-terminal domain-containing protein n=1 Tax=Trichoderma asperellum (strain ATCC 204424 / CBS 433.97 / NBRC 101777) TaxID=1042311 RepID=A0A2T3YXR1_TRIA4|nr:hypothetical protein M441DRAFT_40099 [Trichoderma asperellum CBS 433.97]PTB37353.1 hypothetical protein M441DRAFT_40099 [Trichoderma asperellum CBS 433.97]
MLIDGHILGGAGLGVDSYISTTIQIHREVDATSVVRFSINIPFGSSNEDDGFGVCHTVNRQNNSIPPTDSYRLVIKFPTSPKLDFTVKPADDSLRKLLPATDKKLSSLVIHLTGYLEVEGFGMPFANRGHPSEGVVSDDKCIKGSITLMGMIRRLKFHFIVASHESVLFHQLDAGIPAPFRYPYGEEHHCSEERYDQMLPKTKGHQFKPSWSFDNDNEHLAALTQSQVQDVMWIHKTSQKIAETKFPAYFIKPLNCPPEDYSLFHVILPLGQNFFLQHEDAWRVLTKSGYLKLRLFDNEEDKNPAKWDARIQEGFKTLDTLHDHPVDKFDLVLQVRRPKSTQPARRPYFEVKVFEDRIAANVALRKGKENWTCVSLDFEDQLRDYIPKVDAVNELRPQAQPTNPIACGIPEDVVDAAAKTDGRLPISPDLKFKMDLHRDMLRGKGFWKTLVSGTVNAAEDADQALDKFREPDITQGIVVALFKEVLLEDRHRLMKYLSELYLGLGLITAGPGFGKTAALAIAALAMLTTLKRVFATAPTNVAADNFAERLDRISQRVTARLNEGKSADDMTRVRSALVLRGCKPDEEVDAFFNTLKDPQLGDKAGPNNNWGIGPKWRLHLSPSVWLLMVLRSPAVRPLSANDPLAIHEMQAKMDSKLTYARFRDVATGAITWQEHEKEDMVEPRLVAEMLNTILRNADIVCTTPAISCQPPFKWWKEQNAQGIVVMISSSFTDGPGSIIANHSIGQTLENYLKTRFPQLKSARAGALQEVFIHCPGTVCVIDEVTKSKRNQEQVNRALGFLGDLVKTIGIPASSIAVISHYKANVELFERCRKDPQHSAPLVDMPPAATVDSFQGREADIMVVILGTTKEVGPGFTVDKNRLNVMFSRQRSGMLIFGDIGVLGRVNEQPKAAAARGRAQGRGGKGRMTVTIGDTKNFVKRGMLNNVLDGWSESGRVVEVRK